MPEYIVYLVFENAGARYEVVATSDEEAIEQAVAMDRKIKSRKLKSATAEIRYTSTYNIGDSPSI